MIITHLKATNWRNFQKIDVSLCERQFIVGPNASGKSNFLDIFRFLKDITKNEGGGLQEAVGGRGGMSTIRSLVAEQEAEVTIEVHIADTSEPSETWKYTLGFCQVPQSQSYSHRYFASLTHEQIWKKDELLLNRPNIEDKLDPDRLIRTALEEPEPGLQELTHFFQSFTYMHLVPQLIRFPDLITTESVETDNVTRRSVSRSRNRSSRTQFGHGLLEKIASVDEETLRSRMKTIEEALKNAVPQLEHLIFSHDEIGNPHLSLRCSNWHPNSPAQREDQFSDGTLRLLGLLWTLLESESVILLEEPELSLHVGIVSQLAPLFFEMQIKTGGQILVSTHSDDLLLEPGIDGTEVLMLIPTGSGTEVKVASDIDAVRQLLESGLTAGEIVFSNNNHEHVENRSH